MTELDQKLELAKEVRRLWLEEGVKNHYHGKISALSIRSIALGAGEDPNLLLIGSFKLDYYQRVLAALRETEKYVPDNCKRIKLNKTRPPTNVDKLPVDRSAYIDLMKSLARLKERKMAKKTDDRGRQLIPLFCNDCGEFVKDHHLNLKVVRCLKCAELHRQIKRKQIMDARAKQIKRQNRLKRMEQGKDPWHTANNGLRTKIDLELMEKAEKQAITEGRMKPVDSRLRVCNQACKSRGICWHSKPHVCLGTDDCLRYKRDRRECELLP